jgi:hypothetical protein
MPTTTVTKELFPKATTTLAQVQDERDLRLASGAVRSTIDDQSDPANFILTTERNIVGLDADPASPPARAAAASPSGTGAGVPPAAPAPSGAGVPSGAPAPSGAAALNGILEGFHGTGASPATAGPDHQPVGVDGSRAMAKVDLHRVTALKDRFNAAAVLTGLPPALLGAIASRESRCGPALAPDGTGDFGNGFGIMQVDKRSHTIAGAPDPKSQAHINQASGVLKDFLAAMVRKFPTAPPVRQLQVAVAAYNCGAGGVASLDNADARTTHGDYSNDVWERARFYAIDW